MEQIHYEEFEEEQKKEDGFFKKFIKGLFQKTGD
jgi:hypothetical protein